MSDKQNKLVLENINLVYEVTKRYRNRKNYEDIVSTGYLALCTAATTYDELRGNSFSTYAYRYILGKCLNFINFDKLIKPKRVGSTYQSVTTSIAMDDGLYKKLECTLEDANKKADELMLFETMQKLLDPIEFDIVVTLYSGYNRKETMGLLDISVTQFGAHMQNIKQKLKDLKMEDTF